VDKKVLVIKTRYDFIPLGIGYLLTQLEKNNIDFDYWDMLRPKKNESYYHNKIKNNEYSLIGTGGFVFNINDFIELSETCKKLNANIPIVLGGNITRNLKPEKLFSYLNIDFVYQGEVEASFIELVKAIILNKNNFSEIPGVSYIDKNTNELIKKGQNRVNLSTTFDMPAYHLIDVEYYLTTNKHIRFHKLGKVMPMLTGRGCTGGCSFCSPTVGKFLAPSIQNTMNEIEYLSKNYEFDAFHFITEIFYQYPHEIEEFCQAYKDLQINKPWFCCISPHMDRKVYATMKDAGCVGFNMGLESGSDRILAKTKIGCTVDNFVENFKEAKKNNLFVDVSFMVCNENETAEDMRATFDTLMNNRMQQESFGMTCAYPGTSIYAKAFKRGKVEDELEYIKDVMSGRYWRIYNIDEFDYMNISGMKDEEVFPTMMNEVRRYYSHLYNNFQAKDQKIYKGEKSIVLDEKIQTDKLRELLNKAKPRIKKILQKIPSVKIKESISKKIIEVNQDMNSYKFKGNCCECGEQLERTFDSTLSNGLFENFEICPKCFCRNFFDVINLPQYSSHFKNLIKKIQDSESIVILGRGRIAEDIFLYDLLSLNMDKVKFVIDERSAEEELTGIEEHSDNPNKTFYNKPRLRIDALNNNSFDLLLVTDLLPNQVESICPPHLLSKIEFVNPNSATKKFKKSSLINITTHVDRDIFNNLRK
jgi:anaerobic magnesium-protoporphyrin IX monomethyl ester cyclase